MYKDLFFHKLNPLLSIVIDGYILKLNQAQLGSRKFDKELGLFNCHKHFPTNSEAFLQWRFDDTTAEFVNTTFFVLQNKLTIAKGRKTFQMMPLPVENPFTKQPFIIGADVDRFKYLFCDRADKWWKNVYEAYVKLGIFK